MQKNAELDGVKKKCRVGRLRKRKGRGAPRIPMVNCDDSLRVLTGGAIAGAGSSSLSEELEDVDKRAKSNLVAAGATLKHVLGVGEDTSSGVTAPQVEDDVETGAEDAGKVVDAMIRDPRTLGVLKKMGKDAIIAGDDVLDVGVGTAKTAIVKGGPVLGTAVEGTAFAAEDAAADTASAVVGVVPEAGDIADQAIEDSTQMSQLFALALGDAMRGATVGFHVAGKFGDLVWDGLDGVYKLGPEGIEAAEQLKHIASDAVKTIEPKGGLPAYSGGGSSTEKGVRIWRNRKNSKSDWFIGTSGFMVAQSLWLSLPGLNCIEINSTFYRLPKEHTMKRWRELETYFSLKVSKYITHMKRLKDCKEAWGLFWSRARLLGDKLKAVLFQFPPSFRYTPETLARVRALGAYLPKNGPTIVFEFRDTSWFREETYKIMRRHGWCVGGTAIRKKKGVYWLGNMPAGLHLPPTTSDATYLRVHGSKGYRGYYGLKELGEIRQAVKKQHTHKNFILFNNTFFDSRNRTCRKGQRQIKYAAVCDALLFARKTRRRR